jgi:Ecdysteroid kinase-like family
MSVLPHGERLAADPDVRPTVRDADVAASLRDLDVEWFQSMLRDAGFASAVTTDMSMEPMVLKGAVAEMARVRLHYASPDSAGPTSVIAKIRAPEEQRRQLDAAMNLYGREAHFYDAFASRVSLKSPRCFHIGDGTTTPLILEDLGTLRMGDQVRGLAVTDAVRIVDALATFHAAFWERPETAESWLADPTDDVFAGMIAQLVNSGVDTLRHRFADRVPASSLDDVARLAPRWAEVLTCCARGPQTLVHNDCRLDNVFFDDEGEPVFVDWQVIARTRGTQDVANLLAGSMDTVDLRKSWKALITRYHDRLCAEGVRGYSLDQCIEHYRQSILYPLGQGIALLGALDVGDERGLGDIAVLRALEHCADLDAFSAA